MKFKSILLTALMCLLCMIESAQAQSVIKPIDTSKIVINSSTRVAKTKITGNNNTDVSGTVLFPKPFPAELQGLKCSQLKIFIGETKIETFKSGSVSIPNTSVFYAYKQGFFLDEDLISSKGRCSYEIDNPNEGKPLPPKVYGMMLDIPVSASKGTCKGPFSLTYSDKTVFFPVEKPQIVNFKVEIVCGKPI